MVREKLNKNLDSNDRIEFVTKQYSDEALLEMLHPFVREWFQNNFSSFAPPQKYAIPLVRSRENLLITSPTGSGKTLSAFLAIINELVSLADIGLLQDRVYCVYISPLKALANDIKRNLLQPLQEIESIAEKHGRDVKLRVAIRTGDTSSSEKSKMLKQPPHILITTPESFSIALTSPKFGLLLQSVEWVIVDEVHALAESKRGVQLTLALERLNRKARFARIGLSATVAPLAEVAKFLVGFEDPENNVPRPCKVVDVRFLKNLDLKVISVAEDLINTPFEKLHSSMYKLIDSLVQQHRTTLIFTNTRSATERVVHHLKTLFPKSYTYLKEEDATPESAIGAHHGSLSRDLRFMIEERLKQGKLKVVVSSTSLELGIDIGYIDLVLLLGSPKSVARALQRVGRSGHKLHQSSKGRIIVLDRDDLVECALLVKAALEKHIDNIHIPTNCLDVLAQEIIGAVMVEKWNAKELFNTFRKSYNFKNLSWSDFEQVLKYLAGHYASLTDRNVYAKIWFDPETNTVGRKGKLTRMIYMTNIGTIPDESFVLVKVKKPSGEAVIGKIDEAFLERLRKGDIFVLGGDTYEFLHARNMTAYVRAAVNKTPTIPSWISEMLPLSFELALMIQRFRRYMEELFDGKASKQDVLEFLHNYLNIDEKAARAIYNYFREQYYYSTIPHDKKLVIEHFKQGRQHFAIIHSLYGRRVNDVLSRVTAMAVSSLIKQGKDLEIGVSDNGFYLKRVGVLPVSKALSSLKPEHVRVLAEKSLERTELLYRRFRHCATRALMILRTYKGSSKTVGRQQRLSRILFSTVKKIDKNFPLIKEAKREILEDLMDVSNAEKVVSWISEGKIRIVDQYVPGPSPFGFNLFAQGFSDIVKIEDRQEFLKRLHENVLKHLKVSKSF